MTTEELRKTRRYSAEDRNEALAELRELVPPFSTIYTVLRHVSASGMTRWIDLYVMENDRPRGISYSAAMVMDDPLRTRGNDGIEIGGCGMDMGFALVYNLGMRLFPKGAQAPKGYWRNEPMTWETSGGYCLTQRWL